MTTNEDTNTSGRESRGTVRRVGALSAVTTIAGGSALAMVTAMAGPASASTFTVTQATDDGTGGTPGTLSWAIDQSESNPGADVISFDPSLSTVTMSGSLHPHQITESLAIEGPGADLLTIDLNGNSGLHAYLGADAAFSISDVTISGGSANDSSASRYMGGAILISSQWSSNPTTTVSITGTTFSSNYAYNRGGAVALYNFYGATTISDSTFSGNTTMYGGGAIKSEGELTVTRSVFDGNTADNSGGGLYVSDGEATVIDSTFTNNTAGDGGAITFDFVTGVVRNSTISGNSAGLGGGIMATGTLSLYQTTINGNTATASSGYNPGGGGLWLRQSDRGTPLDTFSIVMSTVSGNTAASTQGNELMIVRCCSPEESSIVGSIVAGSAAGTSIFGAGSPTGFPLNVSDSIIGTTTNDAIVDGGGNQMGVTDPKLGALADNGGVTKTMEPAADSPAIDAGPATVPTFPNNTFDQRGTPWVRVDGSRADIGSVERQTAPTPTSSTTSTSTTSTSTTSTTTPSPTTTIDVSPEAPATPIGGQLLELPTGDAALINPDGTVTDIPIVPTGPASVAFGVTEIGAELGGEKVDDGVRLDLTVGGDGTGDGFGFQPGSTASVFILSDPHRLGTAEVNPDGTFDVPFVVPGDLPVGAHTVQLQGIGWDGQPRALSAGVSVSGNGSALPTTGRDLTVPMMAGGALLLAGGAGVLASRRARRA